jgi:NhaP-type Na+/H+ or K+/H+ antiporter
MEHTSFSDPALTIALALAAGMLATTLARHLRVPSIVLLLATGVLLGPDLLGIVRPDRLGASLQALVGFAVAVILFEGGMNLNFQRLRQEGRTIRWLITLGALITAAGGALAAHFILGWEWIPSILFGTLVIVTGPTVVTPLLRRFKVKERVATVLEAEGVLIDAVGAIIAVVALELALAPAGRSLALGAWDVFLRLGVGAALGAAGGYVITLLLRHEKTVPEGLESVFTLALVLALFQVSNAILSETGIVTVVAAGLVVGNRVRSQPLTELREFKEQLTVMLIGLLFVLLAADVRMSEVRALGWPGVLTVLALMLVVRPVQVAVCTYRSDLTLRERSFLAWLAPRGIVAAAVSSLFAQTLAAEGIPGGDALRAMVFLVIALTVSIQGLTGGFVADLLGLRRRSNTGYVILGANGLARAVGRVLRDGGEEVIFVDSNPEACREAQEEGFRVIQGSALEERIQQAAELDIRAGCLGVTSNEEVNLLFARRARKDWKVPRVWVALRREHVGLDEEIVQRLGARILFGEPHQINLWTLHLERGLAATERWRRTASDPEPALTRQGLENLLLPLAVQRNKKVFPMDDQVTPRKGDLLHLAIHEPTRGEAEAWLNAHGWAPEGAALEETASEAQPIAVG